MTKEEQRFFNSDWERDEYICTHYGEEPGSHHRSVVPPIYETSLHVYEDYQTFVDAQKNEQENYLYLRGTNPTVEIVEKKLAALERGECCKCFASGMAAISATVLSLLRSGEHLLIVGNVYGTTFKLAKYLKEKWNIQYTAVPSLNVEDVEQATQNNTKVIFIESPTSMTFQLVDVEKIVALARTNNIKTIMDNTWSTPLFQKPLQLGVDVVVHSAAKYLSGHSDILAGAVISDKTTITKLFDHEFTLFGAVLAPFEAWLLLRGLRTLPMRMKSHEERAFQVAEFLEGHAAVKKVNYPGLESSPYYELGKKYLSGYAGVLSFELKNGNYELVKKVIDGLQVFQIGYSFGSYESLVLSENNGTNEVELKERKVDPGTIRLSVGLESGDLLIRDLKQALSSL
ncbi:MAG: aminotransferase class I/II-fold pyridoxal phosphate-dependent enzyme [Bacillus sp. (in: Bacteria)]|nr:aminotransferase class I/II-fold pyridoxal phosphate-dependent enzyme [Bacillus sp. (in: firmicutes)]